MKIFEKLMWLSGILLLLTACTKQDKQLAPAPPEHLVKVAGQHQDLNLFAEAIHKAGLSARLSSGNYTVFAPTNKALQNYLNQLEVSDIDGWINTFGLHLVKNILLYHVVKGADIEAQQISSSFVRSEAVNKKSHRLSLYTSRVDTLVKLNGEACFSEMNIEADNGVIHSIDAVLSLPTLASLLKAHPAFSSYLSALENAPDNLTTMLHQENNDLSLFVPTNAAFVDYYNHSPYVQSLNELVHYYGSANLRDRMKYHMLGKSVRSKEISNRSYSTLLPGYSLELKKDPQGNISLTDVIGTEASVVIADITAVNGVIHSINALLSQQ